MHTEQQHPQRDDVSSKQTFPADSATEDLPLYRTDEFRMYCLKVLPCSKRYCHDWTTCPFVHPGEKAKRRDPRVCAYTGVACPEMKKNMQCPRGDSCPYAHNVFEYWLHPSRYRTQLCNDGIQCRRKVCFFAHTLEELRMSSVKVVPPELAGRIPAEMLDGFELDPFRRPSLDGRNSRDFGPRSSAAGSSNISPVAAATLLDRMSLNGGVTGSLNTRFSAGQIPSPLSPTTAASAAATAAAAAVAALAAQQASVNAATHTMPDLQQQLLNAQIQAQVQAQLQVAQAAHNQQAVVNQLVNTIMQLQAAGAMPTQNVQEFCQVLATQLLAAQQQQQVANAPALFQANQQAGVLSTPMLSAPLPQPSPFAVPASPPTRSSLSGIHTPLQSAMALLGSSPSVSSPPLAHAFTSPAALPHVNFRSQEFCGISRGPSSGMLSMPAISEAMSQLHVGTANSSPHHENTTPPSPSDVFSQPTQRMLQQSDAVAAATALSHAYFGANRHSMDSARSDLTDVCASEFSLPVPFNNSSENVSEDGRSSFDLKQGEFAQEFVCEQQKSHGVVSMFEANKVKGSFYL